MSVAHRTLECPVFSQLLPKKKSKSRAWEHFGLPTNESGQIVSEDIAVCKLCRSPVSAKSGSTSNLFGHLRLLIIHYSFLKFLIKAQRQKFMTDFQQLDDQASKRTTDSVTKFLVCTMQPYNLVDRKEFINMVKVLNPRYSLPGRKHFTATAVSKLYNEWALKSACLACAHFDDDHNGKNIAEVLRSILNDWGIDVQNIMSITTDNGRNILKSIEELNLENAHISCFAHNINIGVNHSLDIPVLKRAIARLKKLQNAFAMSWKMKKDLHKAQELLQMEVKTLPSACPTRWWSTLKLVKRFLENLLPICKTLLEYSNKKHLMLEGN
ncbi:zinc finger BED domain-containing protein 1 [Trichonephila clavipes]|nr:zinc finger BED domain-containing protein 1 [Trichonephila clavipes]